MSEEGVSGGGTSGRRRHSAADAWRRALEATAPIADNPSVTLPVVIEQLARPVRRGSGAAVGRRDAELSRSWPSAPTGYARWALDQGLAPGDVVALLMPNCPEYLAIWLGITRVGGVVALINTNLVGAALTHCARHRRAEAHRRSGVAARRADTALPQLDAGIAIWVHGADGHDLPRIDDRYLAKRCRPEHVRAANDPRPRALHLHLGHDRAAQGGERQPLSG